MRKSSPQRLNIRWWLAALAALVLTSCSPKKAAPTPTMSVDAIYTAAFKTLTVQQATQKALIPPTPVPTDTLFPTLAAPPTLAPIQFGTATAPAGGSVPGCDNSAFISETVPDGSAFDPGKKFTKAWTLMDNGTCNWTTSYKLHFLDGDQMNGQDTYVSQDVPVGQQIQVSVTMNAPEAAGTYKGRWQMENAASQPFGSIVWVQIKVGALATNTPSTPAPSATPAVTPTR